MLFVTCSTHFHTEQEPTHCVLHIQTLWLMLLSLRWSQPLLAGLRSTWTAPCNGWTKSSHRWAHLMVTYAQTPEPWDRVGNRTTSYFLLRLEIIFHEEFSSFILKLHSHYSKILTILLTSYWLLSSVLVVHFHATWLILCNGKKIKSNTFSSHCK